MLFWSRSKRLLSKISKDQDFILKLVRESADVVNAMKKETRKMMEALARLQTEVAESRNAVDSAVTLIGGLSDQIRELVANAANQEELTAQLNALADNLDAQQADLAAAVATDPEAPAEPETPAEPEAPVEPETPAEPETPVEEV